MGEAVEVEVGAELSVDHPQHVEVELGRDPGGVVVGRFEPADVLDQIGAEQERVARAHAVGEVGEELLALGRPEVADGRAEEGDHPPTLLGDRAQVPFEVADHRVDGRARVLGGDGIGGRRARWPR